MPVRLDTYYPDIDQTSKTAKSFIVALLYSNSEYGYRPVEVRDILDLPHGAATTIFKHLHEQDYIGKTDDGYYHAVEAREDIRRHVASLDHLNYLFNQLTDESRTSIVDADGTFPDHIDDAEIEAELAKLERKIEE